MQDHKQHREAVRQEQGYKTSPSAAKCVRCGGKPLTKRHRIILRERREQEARLVEQQEDEQRAKQQR